MCALVGVTPAAADPGRVLFHLQDRRITEASGLAIGRASPGVLYMQNDSGDSSRFFAVDRRTGATAATVQVPDARNQDWEDIAAAPDSAGTPSVWLADIGDNAADRSEVLVYRVDEPRIAASAQDRRMTATRPDVWRLRYPSGPTDAESFAVTPAGVGYVVTKSFFGTSTVYRLPARPDPDRVQELNQVATVRFTVTGTPGGPNPIGQLTATSASFSDDGTVFAIRTYTDAYVWRVVGGDLAAALAAPPVRVALPAQPQGEGLAVDGSSLLIDSEGVGSAVYEVPLPTTLPRPSSSLPVPRTSTISGRVSSQGGHERVALLVGALVVLAGLTGGLGRVARRRRNAARYP